MERETTLLTDRAAQFLYFVPGAPGKEELKSKGNGVQSIHFIGSDDTIELILRTVTSVNQLSVYGAAADLCREPARNSPGTGKPATNDDLESIVILTEFLCSNAGFSKNIEKGQFFISLGDEAPDDMKGSCRE